MKTAVGTYRSFEEMNGDRSEPPPSVRRTTDFREDGTLVMTYYDERDQVVRQTYYWSRDEGLLMSILASLQQAPEQS
jgi:hypothetical protein